ncbi:MAG: mercury resistance system transport protein MerF [Paracoccaceae bacterium]|nr:mercury resistance system transport protein MerF [Paracoccaceae bacterium]
MSRLSKIGIFGAVIAAICCFTPVLLWLLPAIGLASLVAGLYAVLLPALGLFILIAVIGLIRDRRNG